MIRSLAVLGITAIVSVVFVPSAVGASCAPAGGRPFGFATHPEGAFTFSGKGWGHGIGMSQYGADGAARTGCDGEQILTTYYRGVEVRQVDPSPIRVGLFPDRPGGRAQQGVEIINRSENGIRWVLDGTSWTQPSDSLWTVRTRADGTFVVSNETGDPVIDRVGGEDAVLTVRVRDSIELPQKAHRYRYGTLEFRSRGGEGVSLTLRLTLERYLYGLREVPSSFEPAAQRAQAIAGRSYAARAVQNGLRSNCTCHLYDSVWDQVYAGTTGETEVWRNAVDATNGQVLWYEGRVAQGFYASSHGGHSEAAHYVWGSGPAYDYLQAVDDSNWDRASSNPYRTWTASLTAEEVTNRLRTHPDTRLRVGTVVRLRVVSRGISGRAGRVEVTGTEGQAVISGPGLRRALSLRSTLLRIHSDVGGTPVTGDWNDDGTDDPGLFRAGRWALRLEDGSVVRFRFGRIGDRPIVGDWNGDGVDTVGVVRDGKWYLRDSNSSGRHDVTFSYGRSTDRPVAGDWDGDGDDTPAIVRNQAMWHLKNSLNGGRAWRSFRYGSPGSGDHPVVGDWDADPHTEIGLVRGDRWLLRRVAGGGHADWAFRYGRAALDDRPVVGDWDGDGNQSVGIVRDLTWHLRNRLGAGSADRSFIFAG